MIIFRSEEDLVSLLDGLDSLVAKCADGRLTYEQFVAEYGFPYGEYALDGHESDEEELALLTRYRHRLEIHRRIAEEVLCRVCDAANAELESYRTAGRIGPAQAHLRVRELALEFLPGTSS